MLIAALDNIRDLHVCNDVFTCDLEECCNITTALFMSCHSRLLQSDSSCRLSGCYCRNWTDAVTGKSSVEADAFCRYLDLQMSRLSWILQRFGFGKDLGTTSRTPQSKPASSSDARHQHRLQNCIDSPGPLVYPASVG